MPAYFITGASTSGKSTIACELVKRGFEAYDTEHNGMSAWYSKMTHERVAEFGQMPRRTKEWLDHHEWLISISRVKSIATHAQERPVFLCGGGANEHELWSVCKQLFWLRTDEATIRRRVTIPRDHTYGTKPHELRAAIEANARKEVVYRDLNASMIDARQPIPKVVDDILSLVTLP